MKRIKFWMLAAILVCGTTSLLTACSSSDDDTPATPVTPQTPTDNTPRAKADYTILYYAQGGGDLDINIITNMSQFYEGLKTAPADKYILVMSSHGGGYLPQDDFFQSTIIDHAATRGIIYDDGFDGHFFGLPDITKALQTSGQHMTAIYLDACLMNTLEYQFELQPLTDYLILSSFSVPALGGQYGALVQQLGTKSLETALSEYVKNTVSFWDANGGPTPHHDMTVTRTSALAAFGTKMKEFTDKLTDAYKNGGSEVKIAINAADGTLKSVSTTTGETLKAGRWVSDFDHSYKMTKFDKATGWSRWIELNEQEPNERSAADWGI